MRVCQYLATTTIFLLLFTSFETTFTARHVRDLTGGGEQAAVGVLPAGAGGMYGAGAGGGGVEGFIPSSKHIIITP